MPYQEVFIGEKARNLMSKRPSGLLRMGTVVVIFFLCAVLFLLWKQPYKSIIITPCVIEQIDSVYIAYGRLHRKSTNDLIAGHEAKAELITEGKLRRYHGRIQDVHMNKDSIYVSILLKDIGSIKADTVIVSVVVQEQPVLKQIFN